MLLDPAAKERLRMAEKKLRFKITLIVQEGTSATGFYAPFDVPQTFGTRARVPVRGTINGFPFRSSLMPMGGGYCMAVNKTLREGAKAVAGDEVEVVLERDTAERTIEAPAELKKELAKNKKAREKWDSLAFTIKKEMANSITGAKQEETKKRRLTKVLQVLKTGSKWTG
jgi:TusA-related sulfurtransferase